MAVVVLCWTGCSGDSSPNELVAIHPAIVAPLFVHGEGQTLIGEMFSTPPLLLGDDEAIQTITEELKRAGLELTERDVPLADAVPLCDEERVFDWITRQERLVLVDAPGPGIALNVNANDRNRRIGFKFVGREAHGQFHVPATYRFVELYDFKELTRYLGKHARQSGKGMHIGFFYDPVTWVDVGLQRDRSRTTIVSRRSGGNTTAPMDTSEQVAQMEAARLAARSYTGAAVDQNCGEDADSLQESDLKAARLSKRLLRLQVRDFVEWLKARGAI